MKKPFILFFSIISLLCSCGNHQSASLYSAVSNAKDAGDSSLQAKTLTLESGQKFNYLLYSPKKIEKNLPLILYLHGGSGKPETEEGNLNLLTEGDGLPKYIKDKEIEPLRPILNHGLDNSVRVSATALWKKRME